MADEQAEDERPEREIAVRSFLLRSVARKLTEKDVKELTFLNRGIMDHNMNEIAGIDIIDALLQRKLININPRLDLAKLSQLCKTVDRADLSEMINHYVEQNTHADLKSIQGATNDLTKNNDSDLSDAIKKVNETSPSESGTFVSLHSDSGSHVEPPTRQDEDEERMEIMSQPQPNNSGFPGRNFEPGCSSALEVVLQIRSVIAGWLGS